MTLETLTLENETGPIVTLTLNRPARLNALTLQMVHELTDVFRALSNSKPRVLIITGAGRAFCAGADLQDSQFEATNIGASVSENMEHHYNPMVAAYRAMPCPVVAMVNGVAAGGGASLALLADIVVAAKSATFVQVFGPQLGLVPDLGSTWVLPRLVGRARARGLALLGDRLDATTAEAWGLIWKSVDDAALQQTVQSIAERLAAGPTVAFDAIGRALDESLDHSLDEQLEVERHAQRKLAEHPHFLEAVRAFREKRKPRFD